MNPYLIIILGVLIGTYLLEVIVETANLRHFRTELPPEFAGHYDPEKYGKSQAYLRDNTRFEIVTNSFFTPLTVAFILLGGFNLIDRLARSFHFGLIPTGLVFAGVLTLISTLLHTPFSAYQTFIIEEKYGFNKTTIKTFIFDILKSLFLTALIGGVVFAGIIWFFNRTGQWAWLYCWAAVTVFQVFLIFIAPVVILPLFNKFIPLPEGELKEAIENYAKSRNFKMKGVFTMDASRRSTKSNAFFTGYGRFRRIVLFDTLIAKHTASELVAVLAHEVGHWRKKHIHKSFLISTVSMGVMFFILSFFIDNPKLAAAFRMEETSIYASLFFFAFLYAPIETVLSILRKALSRKFEYEADAYAAKTFGKPEILGEALKKLSVDTLSNLTPHPWKVFLSYSHPPILERIRGLRNKRL